MIAFLPYLIFKLHWLILQISQLIHELEVVKHLDILRIFGMLLQTEVLKQLSSMGRLVICAGDGAVQSSTNL